MTEKLNWLTIPHKEKWKNSQNIQEGYKINKSLPGLLVYPRKCLRLKDSPQNFTTAPEASLLGRLFIFRTIFHPGRDPPIYQPPERCLVTKYDHVHNVIVGIHILHYISRRFTLSLLRGSSRLFNPLWHHPPLTQYQHVNPCARHAMDHRRRKALE